MSDLPHRALGASGLEVSLFSLGSWRSFERIPREQALAVMRSARDVGITFVDDARYDEFWPEQDATAELNASLGRIALDHVDLIYSMPPPEGLPVADLVAQVVGLVTSGRARAWGSGNWSAPLLAEAVEVCRAEGFPLPCAAQLQPGHQGLGRGRADEGEPRGAQRDRVARRRPARWPPSGGRARLTGRLVGLTSRVVRGPGRT